MVVTGFIIAAAAPATGTAGAATEAVAFDAVAFSAEAPGLAEYPDTDVIILYDKTSYDIDASGRVTMRVHQVRKLLTMWAFRSLSDLRVAWDCTRQELEILTCRTILQDGTTIDTPDRGFNEVTPDAVSRYADFLDLREMVISHVGTRAGCIVELSYEIRDLTPPVLPASSSEFMQGPYPTLTRIVELRSQPDVGCAVINGEHLPGIEPIEEPLDESGAGCYRRWTARDIPGLPAEADTRFRGDYLPYVVFSTATEWRALTDRLHAETKRTGAVDDPLRAWLAQDDATDEAERVGDLTTLDTVQRIAALVGSRLRTVDLASEPWLRAPRPVSEVFGSSCGTTWEKGILATTLLRQIGLEPELGLFSRWQHLPADVCAPNAFADVRVVVVVDQETYWLDPDHDTARPGRCDLLGKTGLFLEKDGTSFRTYAVGNGSGDSRLAIDARPDDAGDGFLATIDLTLTGVLCDDQRDAESVASACADELFVDGEVTDVQEKEITPGRLHLRCAVKGSQLADAVGELIAYAIPQSPRGVASVLPSSFRPGDEDRATPVFITSACSEQLEFRLLLPESLSVDHVPPTVVMNSPHGAFRQSCGVEGRRLVFSRKLSVEPGAVEPHSYQAFREVLAAAQRPDSQLLILLTE